VPRAPTITEALTKSKKFRILVYWQDSGWLNGKATHVWPKGKPGSKEKFNVSVRYANDWRDHTLEPSKYVPNFSGVCHLPKISWPAWVVLRKM
jgi:hypothetical protein